MKSISRENHADITEAFNSTSRYVDDLLNIYNVHFQHIVDRMYSAEFKLNKANPFDTKAPFNPYLMVQFQIRFMIKGTISILIL